MEEFEFHTRIIDGKPIVYSRKVGEEKWTIIPEKEIKRGTEHELEHADTIETIKEQQPSVERSAEMIALDHLAERVDYYDRLEKAALTHKEKMAKGGEVKGKSHAQGGETFEVGDSGQLVELEGDEGVINKKNMRNPSECEIKGEGTLKDLASAINEYQGHGVNFGDTSDIKIECEPSKGKRPNSSEGDTSAKQLGGIIKDDTIVVNKKFYALMEMLNEGRIDMDKLPQELQEKIRDWQFDMNFEMQDTLEALEDDFKKDYSKEQIEILNRKNNLNLTHHTPSDVKKDIARMEEKNLPHVMFNKYYDEIKEIYGVGELNEFADRGAGIYDRIDREYPGAMWTEEEEAIQYGLFDMKSKNNKGKPKRGVKKKIVRKKRKPVTSASEERKRLELLAKSQEQKLRLLKLAA